MGFAIAIAELKALADSGHIGAQEAWLDITDPGWDDQDYEGPTCSICDALGHGYPGGGPCPLEQADYSGEPPWAI